MTGGTLSLRLQPHVAGLDVTPDLIALGACRCLPDVVDPAKGTPAVWRQRGERGNNMKRPGGIPRVIEKSQHAALLLRHAINHGMADDGRELGASGEWISP